MQEKAESELESARLHLLRFDHEIRALNQEKTNQMAKIENLRILKDEILSEIEKRGNEIEGIEKELKNAVKRNEWIQDNQK